MSRVPVVVMGVSGAGKSTVGRRIAELAGRHFIDADDLHPLSSRNKMAAGVPLTDADRKPWLEAVADAVLVHDAPVVACSALKRIYREQLRAELPGLRFVYLLGDDETIRARLRARSHAFMPESLLSTQLDTLEPPSGEPDVLELDIRLPITELAEAAILWLRRFEQNTDAEVRG